MNSKFLIAAASSGSGKTTLTLGLLRSLSGREWSVAPFKCGPDYIDPLWHKTASGSQSINLDLFMSSEQHVATLFSRFSANKDVSVVEGVMGMFDGFHKMQGSSAHIAQIIDAPVVLLVNAASTAYSVAATIHGFKSFCKDVKLAGVVFNRVASPSHFSFLKDACADAGVPCFGYIPRLPQMEMPSRYLGLSIESQQSMNSFISMAAEAVESYVDVDALLTSTQYSPAPVEINRATKSDRQLTVAVARDDAFNFIYPANILSLTENPRYNVAVEYFSPLNDCAIPQCDILYLPGGYPELYAHELEANGSMRRSIKEFAENGGRVFAECGGMMYLTQAIDSHKLCGVLPFEATMEGARLSLGYRKIEIDGNEWRGHEFHYSHLTNPAALPSCGTQYSASGKQVSTPVYRYKNVIAGYTHLYWGDKDFFDLWQI